jgi:hypothetical protein
VGTPTHFRRVFDIFLSCFFLSHDDFLDLSCFSWDGKYAVDQIERSYLAFAASTSDLREDVIADFNGVARLVLDLAGHFGSGHVRAGLDVRGIWVMVRNGRMLTWISKGH